MIPRAIILSPEARADLLQIHDWIAEAAAPSIALHYFERIEAYLQNFDLASERGTRRDDIRPGLRTIGFDRRLTIAFTVGATTVTILRVFYGGRDWRPVLEDG